MRSSGPDRSSSASPWPEVGLHGGYGADWSSEKTVKVHSKPSLALHSSNASHCGSRAVPRHGSKLITRQRWQRPRQHTGLGCCEAARPPHSDSAQALQRFARLQRPSVVHPLPGQALHSLRRASTTASQGVVCLLLNKPASKTLAAAAAVVETAMLGRLRCRRFGGRPARRLGVAMPASY